MSDFLKAIPHILQHEGGWVNNPNDPGGATNWGVSLRFALAELNKDEDGDGWLDGDFNHDGHVDADDIRVMTKDDAIKVYRLHFWDPFHYDLINDQAIANKVFDMCVNMGSGQAHKITQRAVNNSSATQIGVDGALGPGSRTAINGADASKLIVAICQEQAAFYLNLIAQKPKLAEFKNGWLKRASWNGQ